MGLCYLSGGLYLLHCGIFVAPAQVLLYGARKKFVFLQHHPYPAVQLIEVVLLNIAPIDNDLPCCGIIEAWNQLQQSGFTGTGSPHDSYGGTRLYIKTDIMQYIVIAARIAKIDIAEFDPAAPDFIFILQACRCIFQRRLSSQHLQNALRRGRCACNIHDDHREHHQRHKYLHQVIDQRYQLSYLQSSRDYLPAPDPQDYDNRDIQNELHQRKDGNDYVCRLDRSVAQVFVGCREFARLVPLAHK